MPDNIPETGDVVIHSSGTHVTPSFTIRVVPGPDQIGCATRAEAERMARSCAKQSGVNLWFSEGQGGFTLLAGFRRAARGRCRRTPSIDGVLGAVPIRRPTTVA
jgi:hypothetical protein